MRTNFVNKPLIILKIACPELVEGTIIQHMNILFVILFSSIMNVGPNTDAHEFHLSKSTINYNTKDQTLQITMNMFIDDLELALQPTAGDTLRLCTRKERVDAEDSIHTYILEHLKIEINGKIVTPEFLGKEQSDDLAAVWCYLEVVDIPLFSEMNLTNNIMIELFDDQKNMTNIQLDKQRVEDILFTSGKTTEKIEMYD
jgi:hypothetical protein